jgi:hypothetical protein
LRESERVGCWPISHEIEGLLCLDFVSLVCKISPNRNRNRNRAEQDQVLSCWSESEFASESESESESASESASVWLTQ